MTGRGEQHPSNLANPQDLFSVEAGIRSLLDRDSFPRAGRVLRQVPALLSGDADRIFEALAEPHGSAEPGYPVEAIGQLRAFLDRCRRSPLETVFPPGRDEIDPDVFDSVAAGMGEADAAEEAFAATADAAQLALAADAWGRVLRNPRLSSAYPGLVAALQNNAGALHLRRFWEVGDGGDLTSAHRLLTSAVALTPLSSPQRARRLSNLAMASRELHQRTGDLGALDRAVRLLRDATIAMDSGGSPLSADVLINLALVLRDRYRRTGDAADLAEAVSIGERARRESDSPGAQVMLGDLLTDRYLQTGSTDDLATAVQLLTRAVDGLAGTSPERPRALVDLAIVLLARHSAVGDPADLQRAVKACEEAASGMGMTSPDRPGCLVELAMALYRRFEVSGSLDDLDRAAVEVEQAIATAGRDELAAPGWRVNLATILQRRWRLRGSDADLDTAITLLRSAAEPAAARAGERTAVVNNLGNALRERGRSMGAVADLDQAVQLLREALSRAESGTPLHLVILGNLGMAVRDRYDAVGRPEDLAEAVTIARRAAAGTPPGDPDGPRRLFFLATAERAVSHDDAAVEAYRQGVSTGILLDPESTLIAMLEWGGWATHSSAWLQAAEAYDGAIAASSALVERQTVRSDQENWLHNVADLAPRAAYAATAAGRLHAAVVAVERTRATLLSQSLRRDNADLERLAADAPGLAERYSRAVHRIQAAASAGGRPN